MDSRYPAERRSRLTHRTQLETDIVCIIQTHPHSDKSIGEYRAARQETTHGPVTTIVRQNIGYTRAVPAN